MVRGSMDDLTAFQTGNSTTASHHKPTVGILDFLENYNKKMFHTCLCSVINSMRNIIVHIYILVVFLLKKIYKQKY